MVELIINGISIELPKETTIKYTKQISDIFDLANVSCSYTNSFEFEKTPFNTQAMQFLGISGDTSAIPYIKNNSSLKLNGFDLISNGWFNTSGTEDNYKGSIIDGMIDFFKAIENKTIGDNLDLSNFDHTKDMATVLASFTNDYYNYIIADYGGKTLFNNGINIDYLAPCFSVRKLWELIFSTFNFNCDYSHLSYLDGLYITYPKDVEQTVSSVVVATLVKNPYASQQINKVAGVAQPNQFYFWDSLTVIEGVIINNWKYQITETASYTFDLTVENYVIYRYPSRANRITNPQIQILKNGVQIGIISSDFVTNVDGIGDPRNIVFTVPCDNGDIIELIISCPANLTINGHNYRMYEWRHNNTAFIISKTDLGTTNLQNEFKDFLIRDFIKEIIWRTGLTPVYDKETNTVEFIPLDDRINFSLAQDLSACYIKRTGEIYQNDYAQKNSFKLKNDSDTDFTGNGYLYVPNKNISDEKTLVQSKIYAPDKKIVTDFINFSTNQYKIWQAESKENNDNEIEITYKGLSGRFYFIRKQTATGSFKITSEKLEDEETVFSVPYGVNTNTLFEESVYNYYSEYQKIFTNFRIHAIRLNVTELDFLGLDMTRPVYFKQENAFYICNKIDFQEGQFSSGEFVKINK